MTVAEVFELMLLKIEELLQYKYTGPTVAYSEERDAIFKQYREMLDNAKQQ